MSLKEDLAGAIPADKLHLLSYYEMVGDVAVISLPPGLEVYGTDAAEAIMAKRKNIRTVLNKLSKIEGDRRVPRYEILRGEDAVATYHEYGFEYRFDLMKVFFNPGLKFERHRIADMAAPGEKVLLPFAGAGPFVVPLAAKGCRVLAVEMNADACKWLVRNVKANGVCEDVDVLNADALDLPHLLRMQFDRAVVPAPYGMDEYLDVVMPLVKAGGRVHFYTFKKKYQIEGLAREYEGKGLCVEGIRRCGNVAPDVSRWAFDLAK